MLQQVPYLPVDQFVQDGPPELRVVERHRPLADALLGLAPQRQLQQLANRQQPQLQRVVGVVRVVRHAVGGVDHLGLDSRAQLGPLLHRAAELAIERFVTEIQARESPGTAAPAR